MRDVFRGQDHLVWLLNLLLAISLLTLTASTVSAQETRVLLDDARALVLEVNLSPGQTYLLPKRQTNVVWVAINPLNLSTRKGGLQVHTLVVPGAAAAANPDEECSFRTGGDLVGRLIVITPKVIQQELTVSSLVFADSLEDASGRNVTLLIAITNGHFRDTRNHGDESEWISGRPNIVTMAPGDVRWIRPGIHHFKNLGPMVAKLVSIEW